MYLYKWSIGDWSDDGHGKVKDVLFETTYPIDSIREWYLLGCEASGIAFHPEYANKQYGLNLDASKIDCYVSTDGRSKDYYNVAEIIRRLVKEGLSPADDRGEDFKEFMPQFFERIRAIDPNNKEDDEEYDALIQDMSDELEGKLSAKLYVLMIMEMIKRFVYPDLDYELKSKAVVESVNGFWNKELNVHIGYELYMEW